MSQGSGGGWSDWDPDSEQPEVSLELPEFERYERVDLIGVGGMGRVFEAFDRKLQRRVALKEVAPELAGTAAAHRLATEVLLTADLEHPGIVSVHDGGRTEDGRLYYTMRLVRGRSLAARLTEAARPRARLALLRHVLDACHAVGYAHSRGVVHRDLKPANIMIGEFGETQVVDWGLARRLDSEGGAGTSAGTRGYMSPEAEAGERAGTRSDVYSLGATIAEVAGPDAAPDLRALVRRALDPDPARRYPDAHELAVDLGNYLDGRRVEAHDYSPAELARRLVIAWKAPLTVAAVAAGALAVVTGGAWLRTTASRDRAVQAESGTRAALVQSDRNLASSLEAQAAAAAREGRFPAAQVLAGHALVLEESPIARGVLAAGGAARRPVSIEVRAMPACDGVRLAGDEVLCLGSEHFAVWDGGDQARWSVDGAVHDAIAAGPVVALARGELVWELRRRVDGALLATHRAMPGNVGFESTPDGRLFGMANGGFLSVFSSADLRRWEAMPCGPDGAATALALDADRAFVACRQQGIVVVSEGAAPAMVHRFPGDQPEPRILAVVDGTLLAGTVKGRLLALDPVTGAARTQIDVLDVPIDTLQPVRGTALVAVSGDRGGVRLWDLDAGVEVMRLPGPTRALTVLDRDRLLIAGAVGLREVVLPSQPTPLRFQAPVGVAAVAISPEGRYLAAARGDGFLTVWSTADGRVLTERRWQERVVKAVAFSADGASLFATGLGDGTVRAWRTGSWEAESTWSIGQQRRMGALADGRIWAVGYGQYLILDARVTGGDAWLGPSTLVDGTTAPGGGAVVFLDEAGAVWVLRADQDVPEEQLRRPTARGVAIDAAGVIAVAHADYVEVAVADGASQRLAASAGGIVDVALSGDGRWAAAGLLDGTALLWSRADGRLVATLVGHRERVASVVFTEDSGTLITGDWAGAILRWSLADAERPAAELLAEAEHGWQMDLEDALAAGR